MEDNINIDVFNGEVDAGFWGRACSRLGTKNNKLRKDDKKQLRIEHGQFAFNRQRIWFISKPSRVFSAF